MVDTLNRDVLAASLSTALRDSKADKFQIVMERPLVEMLAADLSGRAAADRVLATAAIKAQGAIKVQEAVAIVRASHARIERIERAQLTISYWLYSVAAAFAAKDVASELISVIAGWR